MSKASPKGKQRKRSFPQNTLGKFAKDREQLTPQPEIKIDSINKRNFKFSLIFLNIYKTFKIFKICSNLHNVIKTQSLTLFTPQYT